MKRLTTRQRKHQFHRARQEVRRLRARRPQIVSAKRVNAKRLFDDIRFSLPGAKLDYDARPGFCSIIPPAELSLSTNYAETLAFILEMRAKFSSRIVYSPDGKRKLRAFADFATISEIEPAAGLVLAAEVDRWRLASGKQPRSFEDGWQPNVLRFFAQAGLFDLLGIKQSSPVTFDKDDSIETLRFVRGFSVSGEFGSKLRDRLEELCGQSIGPRKKVYDAISEAIANTRHAYPAGISIWPSKLSGRWWASGAWNRNTNTASIQLYDQGVGIPATLPRSEHWTDILKKIKILRALNPEGRDDQLLAAALEVGRTSTGEHGRGNGLAEMASWIDHRKSGFLRIMSGSGIITYRQGGNLVGESLNASFPGTLIEWEIALDE